MYMYMCSGTSPYYHPVKMTTFITTTFIIMAWAKAYTFSYLKIL